MTYMRGDNGGEQMFTYMFIYSKNKVEVSYGLKV